MSHINDIRAQLRSAPPPPSGGFGPHIIGALVFGAIVFGAVYYLFFMPVLVPLKPSASIPTFHRVGDPQDVSLAPKVREPAPNPSRYAGLSFRQTGNLADEVCFARAQARVPHWSKTPRLTTKELSDFRFEEMPHFNELLTCLLTEAPIRYCSRSQHSMIDGEIEMYFRGIVVGNQMLERVKGLAATAQRSGKIDGEQASEYIAELRQRALTVDPRVINAIEARLRDGTLSVRDPRTFTTAPVATQQRFARIQQVTALCPRQPWWAFWRTF